MFWFQFDIPADAIIEGAAFRVDLESQGSCGHGELYGHFGIERFADFSTNCVTGETTYWFPVFDVRIPYLSPELLNSGDFHMDFLSTLSGGVLMDYIEMKIYYSFSSTVSVDIDIKPGDYPNSINLGSHGVIPVAILSSPDFDATQVDLETVLLAGASVAVRGKGSKLLSYQEDINGDGLMDFVIHFEVENLDPGEFQDGVVCLEGMTFGGQAFSGCGEIQIVPDK